MFTQFATWNTCIEKRKARLVNQGSRFKKRHVGYFDPEKKNSLLGWPARNGYEESLHIRNNVYLVKKTIMWSTAYVLIILFSYYSSLLFGQLVMGVVMENRWIISITRRPKDTPKRTDVIYSITVRTTLHWRKIKTRRFEDQRTLGTIKFNYQKFMILKRLHFKENIKKRIT